jgi:hypothetical protein
LIRLLVPQKDDGVMIRLEKLDSIKIAEIVRFARFSRAGRVPRRDRRTLSRRAHQGLASVICNSEGDARFTVPPNLVTVSAQGFLGAPKSRQAVESESRPKSVEDRETDPSSRIESTALTEVIRTVRTNSRFFPQKCLENRDRALRHKPLGRAEVTPQNSAKFREIPQNSPNSVPTTNRESLYVENDSCREFKKGFI